MKTLRPEIKQELAPVFLVLLSFVPLMLIGFILDILLIQFFAYLKGNTGSLNAVSLWIYNNIAGYRFLPQELMMSFWLLMVISFTILFFRAGDPQQFRLKFFYSFLFIWGGAVSVVGCIAFACLKPFDLLSARVEETTWVGNSLQSLLTVELLIMLFLPVVLFFWEKASTAKSEAPAPLSPDASNTGSA